MTHYFDSTQHDGRPSGINYIFPHPPSFKIDQPGQSGIYKTYPPAESDNVTTANSLQDPNNTSEFEPVGLVNQFSNGYASLINGIQDFSAFNAYIHYFPKDASATSVNSNGTPVFIPYISDYEISSSEDEE